MREWAGRPYVQTAAQPRAGLGFHLGEKRVYFFRIFSTQEIMSLNACSREDPHILWQSSQWAFPNVFGISSSADLLRKESLPSHVSITLRSPFKLYFGKIFLFSNTCTHTHNGLKRAETPWRKENLLSKPQFQSGVVTHACSPNIQG